MKVTILVNKHIYSEQLMICHLTYHNLIWSHVNNTRPIPYKAVNFQSMRSTKYNEAKIRRKKKK